ncbi:MAG: DivIVA domain-containing protein [Micrococcales bacterium]|nr:DivIVA domain-containing protein [Micrococcales bacterium]
MGGDLDIVTWIILLAGLVIICLVVAAILGLLGAGMGPATSSLHHEPLTEEPLTDEEVGAIEFDVTARGYRMSQVDGVIDRLRRELREKDEEIAVLRAGPIAQSAVNGPDAPDGQDAPGGPEASDGPDDGGE